MTDTRAAIEAAIQKIVVWMQSDPTWKEATTLQSILTRLIDTVTAGEREEMLRRMRTLAKEYPGNEQADQFLDKWEARVKMKGAPAFLSSPPSGGRGEEEPLPCEGCESRPECDAHDAPPSGESQSYLGERAWLQLIADVALDRDGYHSAKDLGELVDELRQMALDGLAGKPCCIPAPPAAGREKGDLLANHCREIGCSMMSKSCPGDPKCEILRKIASQTGGLLSREEALEISRSTLESAEKERREQDAPLPAAIAEEGGPIPQGVDGHDDQTRRRMVPLRGREISPAAAAPGWVSVEERLPGKNIAVLCTDHGYHNAAS